MSNIVPVSDIERMAMAVAKSGLFGVRTPEQAFSLMLIAQAEGMHPAIAARDYHVINGKPTLKADALLARFQQAGGTVKWLTYTDDKVVGSFSHPAGGTVEISWTMAMAHQAGLTKNPTWKNYPRQMLRARVISEGIRTVFPGVAVGVYTAEEASDPQPTGSTAIDMGPVEQVTPALDDEAIAKAAELEMKIENCDSLDELELLRPEMRALPEELRKAVMAKARSQADLIRSEQAENGAEA